MNGYIRIQSTSSEEHTFFGQVRNIFI